MYHVSAQGVDEHMINVHFYFIFYIKQFRCASGRTIAPLTAAGRTTVHVL